MMSKDKDTHMGAEASTSSKINTTAASRRSRSLTMVAKPSGPRLVPSGPPIASASRKPARGRPRKKAKGGSIDGGLIEGERTEGGDGGEVDSSGVVGFGADEESDASVSS